MKLRQQGIKDIFTKLGKDDFDIWLSGAYRDGEYKAWNAAGQLMIHSFWDNGVRTGEYKSWHDNGQISEHSFWKGESYDRFRKEWDRSGKLLRNDRYKNGEIVS